MQKYVFVRQYHLKGLSTVRGDSNKHRKQNYCIGKTLETNWSMANDEAATQSNESVLDVRIAWAGHKTKNNKKTNTLVICFQNLN